MLPQGMAGARTAAPLLVLTVMPAAVLSVVLLALSPSATAQHGTEDDVSPGLR